MSKSRKKSDYDVRNVYNFLFTRVAADMLDPITYDNICNAVENHSGLQLHRSYNVIVKNARQRKRRLMSLPSDDHK